MKAMWHLAYILGFLLNIGGICCALVAYARTFRLHGKTELFPRLTTLGRRFRGFLARLAPFLRRDTAKTPATGELIATGENVEVQLQASLAIPDDAPISVQIKAISIALNSLRERIDAERQARLDMIARLDARLGGLSGRFVAAVDRLDAKLYDVGVDSLRLQILGVALVMVGTTLLAILGLFPPTSEALASLVAAESAAGATPPPAATPHLAPMGQGMMDIATLTEELKMTVATRQETWAILLFFFGAITAIVYGAINDMIEGSKRKAWKGAGWKALFGIVFLVMLYNSFSAYQRFLLWWRG